MWAARVVERMASVSSGNESLDGDEPTIWTSCTATVELLRRDNQRGIHQAYAPGVDEAEAG